MHLRLETAAVLDDIGVILWEAGELAPGMQYGLVLVLLVLLLLPLAILKGDARLANQCGVIGDVRGAVPYTIIERGLLSAH